MGSSSLYQLARRGVRVLGLDRFRPPHTFGSTHGQTRIIREAYFERPLYVPLVRRAYTLWDELGQQTGTPVYRRTGGLMLGPENGTVVSGSRTSALEHGISHQILGAEEVRRRFPGFTPPDHFLGLWEDRAGLLFAERAVEAHLALAERHGATIQLGSTVKSWQKDGDGVRVSTGEDEYSASQLVLSAGPWIASLVGKPGRAFSVERQLFHWFRPVTDASGWPVALWEHRPGGLFFTLPDGATRIKAGIHHEGETVDPETVNRTPSVEDESRTRAFLATYQPAANGSLIDAGVCLYTNTPDGHFVIDWHPDHENVLVVSPCSGHGFKFASAIGEVVADLVTTKQSRFDLAPFQFRRFS